MMLKHLKNPARLRKWFSCMVCLFHHQHMKTNCCIYRWRMEPLINQANDYMNRKQWLLQWIIGRLKKVRNWRNINAYDKWMVLELGDRYSSAPDNTVPPPAVQAR